MKIDDKIMQLIFDLESIIGESCYNPHSTDGRTGEQGKWIRYPVWAKISNNDSYSRFRGKIYGVLPDNIDNIEYRFGANELQIGTALKEVLEFLEKRYGIDFNILEERRKEK